MLAAHIQGIAASVFTLMHHFEDFAWDANLLVVFADWAREGKSQLQCFGCVREISG